MEVSRSGTAVVTPPGLTGSESSTGTVGSFTTRSSRDKRKKDTRSQVHGTAVPLHVSRRKNRNPLVNACVRACTRACVCVPAIRSDSIGPFRKIHYTGYTSLPDIRITLCPRDTRLNDAQLASHLARSYGSTSNDKRSNAYADQSFCRKFRKLKYMEDRSFLIRVLSTDLRQRNDGTPCCSRCKYTCARALNLAHKLTCGSRKS